jgi:hypothetical protein
MYTTLRAVTRASRHWQRDRLAGSADRVDVHDDPRAAVAIDTLYTGDRHDVHGLRFHARVMPRVGSARSGSRVRAIGIVPVRRDRQARRRQTPMVGWPDSQTMASVQERLGAGDTIPDKSGRLIRYRYLSPTDDLDELTSMLHEAYAPLASAGMRFVASYQDSSVTRQRTERGERPSPLTRGWSSV